MQKGIIKGTIRWEPKDQRELLERKWTNKILEWGLKGQDKGIATGQ